MSLKLEIEYYFKKLGIISFGEYILKPYQNNDIYMNELLQKYKNFLTEENNLPSKINHIVCYNYFNDVQEKAKDISEEIKSIISEIYDDLKINYFNFFLICNLIHYFNRFSRVDKNATSFFLYQLKKFSNLILKYEKDNDNSLVMTYLFFYYYSVLLFRLFKNKPYNYKNESNNSKNFIEYLEYEKNSLYDYVIDNNDEKFKNLEFKFLNDYAEKNKKFEIYFSFIKFFISINNRDCKETIDFELSFYENFNLPKEIKFALLSRKLVPSTSSLPNDVSLPHN